MTRRLAHCLLAGLLYGLALPLWAASGEIHFAVIAHPFAEAGADEAILLDTIEEADRQNLAFVVATGIKSESEPCTDKLYDRRKNIFENSKHAVFPSAAGSDWDACRYGNGRSAALERLNRLRELFFSGEFSLGASKLPLARQSANIKFRDYAENTRWEVGGILFATLNLPADNNRYLSAAGRNGEFEDRLIASRDWLQRLVMLARRNKTGALVLFCDGNPLVEPSDAGGKRDGFAEVRQLLKKLAAQFPGRILVIHNRRPPAKAQQNAISWNGNLGEIGLTSGSIRIAADPSQPMPFTIDERRGEQERQP